MEGASSLGDSITSQFTLMKITCIHKYNIFILTKQNTSFTILFNALSPKQEIWRDLCPHIPTLTHP